MKELIPREEWTEVTWDFPTREVMKPQEKHRLRSHKRTCPYKEKLDLTNGPEYLLAAQKDHQHYHDSDGLELYLCTACGYLHIGHRLGEHRG